MGVIETGTIVARAEAEAEAEVRVQVLTTKVIVEQEMMIRAGAGARVGAKAGVEATHTIGTSISSVIPSFNFFICWQHLI